jgi:hypothetical protein
MGNFTETELALIGAQSVRWPAADTSVQWQALHKVITTARQAARNADTEITAVEGDPELSLQGKKRRSAEIAMKAMNSLETGTHLPHAEQAVGRVLGRNPEELAAKKQLSIGLETARQSIAQAARKIAGRVQLDK